MKINLSIALYVVMACSFISSASATSDFSNATSQQVSNFALTNFPAESVRRLTQGRDAIGDIAPDYLLLQPDGSLDVFIYKAMLKPISRPRARQMSEMISLEIPSNSFARSVRCTSLYVDDMHQFLRSEINSGAIPKSVATPVLSDMGVPMERRGSGQDMLSLRCRVPSHIAYDILQQL